MAQRVIVVEDVTDDTLTQLCLATGLGRGRMLQVAFEHAANTLVGGEQVPPIQEILDRVRAERTVP